MISVLGDIPTHITLKYRCPKISNQSLCHTVRGGKNGTHTRMLRGNLDSLKSATKVRTEFKLLKSNFITSTRASGVSFKKSAFTCSPTLMFRMARTTRAPLLANTLAVSNPIPAVPPANIATTKSPLASLP